MMLLRKSYSIWMKAGVILHQFSALLHTLSLDVLFHEESKDYSRQDGSNLDPILGWVEATKRK